MNSLVTLCSKSPKQATGELLLEAIKYNCGSLILDKLASNPYFNPQSAEIKKEIFGNLITQNRVYAMSKLLDVFHSKRLITEDTLLYCIDLCFKLNNHKALQAIMSKLRIIPRGVFKNLHSCEQYRCVKVIIQHKSFEPVDFIVELIEKARTIRSHKLNELVFTLMLQIVKKL